MKCIRFILIFLSTSTVIFAQQKSDSSLYMNDFLIFQKALFEAHPALYRFTPKETYDSLFFSIAHRISDQTNDLDFFRLMSRVEALIREGHSSVEVSEKLAKHVQKQKLFPFNVFLNRDRLVVLKSYNEEYNKYEGSEIFSINGKSIPSIISDFEFSTGLKSAHNNSGLYNKLSFDDNFAQAYHYFVDTTDTFNIEYKMTNGDKHHAVIRGSIRDSEYGFYPKSPKEPDPPVQVHIDQSRSTAVLKITTFAYWVVSYNKNKYFKVFKEFFEDVRDQKIENLVIDVRGNRGGDELIGAELLTYLVPNQFRIHKHIKAKTLNFDFVNSLSDSKKLTFAKKDYFETDSGYFKIKDERLNSFEPKAKNFYSGRVFVLSDHGSFSATHIFLALIKTHSAGVIVGQESGGAFEDVDGIWRASFKLPYSGITVGFPVWSMKINSTNGDPMRGVIPDHIISKTSQDILSNRDVELEYVKQLISKDRKSIQN